MVYEDEHINEKHELRHAIGNTFNSSSESSSPNGSPIDLPPNQQKHELGHAIDNTLNSISKTSSPNGSPVDLPPNQPLSYLGEITEHSLDSNVGKEIAAPRDINLQEILPEVFEEKQTEKRQDEVDLISLVLNDDMPTPHSSDSSGNKSTSKINLSKERKAGLKEQRLKFMHKSKSFLRRRETGLGQNKLVEPLEMEEGGRKQILEGHREWYVGQAVLMDAYRTLEEKRKTADPTEQALIQQTQDRLALSMLQSYSKAAGLNSKDSGKLYSNPTTKKEHRGLQTTPFLGGERYHRSAGHNPLVKLLTEKTAKDLAVNQQFLKVASDPSIKEVVHRNFPLLSKEGTIMPNKLFSKEELKGLMLNLKNAVLNQGHTIDQIFSLDISALFHELKASGADYQVAMEQLTKMVEEIMLEELEGLSEADQLTVIKNLHNCMQPVVFDEHKGMQIVLAVPLFKPAPYESIISVSYTFMKNEPHNESTLESAMVESGTRVDPVTAKENLLKLSNPLELLKELEIQPTKLATEGQVKVTNVKKKIVKEDNSIPTVFADTKTLMKYPAVTKFKSLADTMSRPVPPYIEVYAEATFDMLNGLTTILDDQGGVEKAFEDRGINEVLQIAYFRIANAAQSAIFHKDDMLAFLNDIELIHDQIQMIIAITQPYVQDVDLERSVQKSMESVVPKKYQPIVRHKASAMHSLSSIFASVEHLKGSEKPVQVLALKDNYYEASGAQGFDGAVQHAKAFKTKTLDGQRLKQDEEMTDQAYVDGQLPEVGSLDLYVCDFHHNISVQSNEYHVEDLISQIDNLYAKNIPSNAFTVAVDCTVDFIESKDNEKLVNHFQDKIDAGVLNIVLFRSAQKFDMLGMDNYYGGFTVTINSGDSGPFKAFNDRMKRDDDQVQGLAHQGMAHIMEHGARHTDIYRKALMDNTQYLYRGLISAGMGEATSPIYIAPTTDPNAAFLDIQFPDTTEQYAGMFYYALLAWGGKNNLALTTRQSFGFATSNLTMVSPKLRLNPGLEDQKSMDKYIEFFKKSAEVLEKTKQKVLSDNPDLAYNIGEKERTLEHYFNVAMKEYWK